MSIKQISVFVENKPGAMSAMTGVLAENNIDMRETVYYLLLITNEDLSSYSLSAILNNDATI